MSCCATPPRRSLWEARAGTEEGVTRGTSQRSMREPPLPLPPLSTGLPAKSLLPAEELPKLQLDMGGPAAFTQTTSLRPACWSMLLFAALASGAGAGAGAGAAVATRHTSSAADSESRILLAVICCRCWRVTGLPHGLGARVDLARDAGRAQPRASTSVWGALKPGS